jgi:P-type E1-E2 ATPase
MVSIMENSLSEKTAQTQRFENLLKFFVPGVMGLTCFLVSGDATKSTLAAGSFVQIPKECTHGGLLPHEKAYFIKALKQSNKKIAMVGDGVNDAPAMACCL